jgi:hypothetical protein
VSTMGELHEKCVGLEVHREPSGRTVEFVLAVVGREFESLGWRMPRGDWICV